MKSKPIEKTRTPDSEAVTVFLDLSEHCVETAARSEHRRLTRKAIEQTEDAEDLAGPLDLLHAFLTGTDFQRVRTEDPRLAGGQNLQVVLRRGDDGLPMLKFFLG